MRFGNFVAAAAGYDGAKCKRGSKVHMAVDTLGHPLALHVTPAEVGDRAAVARLAADIQDATGGNVTLDYVDQGYTGEVAATLLLPTVLPCMWLNCPRPSAVLSCCHDAGSWSDPLPVKGTRCRRLVRDYERYATTLAGFHVTAFVGYMLKHAVQMIQSS